jgi:lysophospholipase L1-like esterase
MQPQWPVVVSEGDSWFDYPFHRSVVTWLDDPRDTADEAQSTPWSLFRLEHSGDEVVSMLTGGQRLQLRDAFDRYPVSALLFSGGGNDIAGPELLPLLNPCQPGFKAADCLNQTRLDRRLGQIKAAYLDLIDLVASSASAKRAPVHIYAHGYDYAPPSPRGVRILDLIQIGPWMLPYLLQCGIMDPALQMDVVRLLIDHFNNLLADLAATSKAPCIFHHIDCRNLVPKGEWKNEIHPTRDGYRPVAKAFATALQPQFPGLDWSAL